MLSQYLSFDVSCSSVEQLITSMKNIPMPLAKKRVSLALNSVYSPAPLIDHLKSIDAIITDVSPNVLISSEEHSIVRVTFFGVDSSTLKEAPLNSADCGDLIILDFKSQYLPLKRVYSREIRCKLHFDRPCQKLQYVGSPFLLLQEADEAAFLKNRYKAGNKITRSLKSIHIDPTRNGYCEHCQRMYSSPRSHRQSFVHTFRTSSKEHWNEVDSLLLIK